MQQKVKIFYLIIICLFILLLMIIQFNFSFTISLHHSYYYYYCKLMLEPGAKKTASFNKIFQFSLKVCLIYAKWWLCSDMAFPLVYYCARWQWKWIGKLKCIFLCFWMKYHIFSFQENKNYCWLSWKWNEDLHTNGSLLAKILIRYICILLYISFKRIIMYEIVMNL
jgi:hypothetical protein